MNSAELRETLANPAPKRIHLIGVAGSGMSGIAALLLGLGHKVSGSDKVDTIEVERLIKKGLVFHCPHSPECVRDADIVIFSSAIKAGNSAFDEAVRLDIPMVRRADALAAIMDSKKGIVVCGMHGKTTTSEWQRMSCELEGLSPATMWVPKSRSLEPMHAGTPRGIGLSPRAMRAMELLSITTHTTPSSSILSPNIWISIRISTRLMPFTNASSGKPLATFFTAPTTKVRAESALPTRRHCRMA